jgi:DNA-binding NtrC family response regulator
MGARSRILLLTRDSALESAFKAALEGEGCHVVEVREASVLGPLLRRGAELVAFDLSLPEAVLSEGVAAIDSSVEVGVLGLDAGTADRWSLLARGTPVEERIALPFAAEEVRQRIAQLVEKIRFLRGADLIGRSPIMRQLRQRILLVAPTPVSTVLLTGESGVGKDRVAEALHRYSPRRSHPFRPINCAAIPENLLENELFGHEKGAYTDAKAQYRGLFEQAEGGTVFLDEIGEMALSAQVRLLRVLEQREVTRIGGQTPIPVDIRVIAATNRDLQEAVAQREFRLDLYHRLKVVELAIPPLRRRPEDIPLLVEHFAEQLVQGHPTRFEGFSPAALDLLQRYEWPGNVRELRNLMEHLVFLAPRSRVEPEDLLPHLESPPSPQRHLPVPTHKTPDQSERELIYFALLDLKREVAQLRTLMEQHLVQPLSPGVEPLYQLEEQPYAAQGAGRQESGAVEPLQTLEEMEKEAIERALQRVNRNRRKAAEILGISTRTLYRKLKEYGLE